MSKMPTRLAISKETKPIAVLAEIVLVTRILMIIVWESRRMTIRIVLS